MSTSTLKRYDNALVFGKFLPMHKGHASLINFALNQAHTVHVVVLAHDGEHISMVRRMEFIREEYKTTPNVHVYGINYNPKELNSSSESDWESSVAWSDFLSPFILKHEIDVLIGSEQYINYMGEYLNLNHVIYDEQRTNIHISATQIKDDLIANWDYLVPSVKRYYAHHICICGSESVGKTTVCTDVEKCCPGIVTMIPEIGRCLVGNAKTCDSRKLQQVMSIHKALLDEVIYDPPTPIILWDTDNYTTLSYHQFLFGDTLPTYQYRDLPKANKYFFFESNIPYIKDATRMEVSDSNALRDHHLSVYSENGIEVEKVSENRSQKVLGYVNDMLSTIVKRINGYDVHV